MGGGPEREANASNIMRRRRRNTRNIKMFQSEHAYEQCVHLLPCEPAGIATVNAGTSQSARRTKWMCPGNTWSLTQVDYHHKCFHSCWLAKGGSIISSCGIFSLLFVEESGTRSYHSSMPALRCCNPNTQGVRAKVQVWLQSHGAHARNTTLTAWAAHYTAECSQWAEVRGSAHVSC